MRIVATERVASTPAVLKTKLAGNSTTISRVRAPNETAARHPLFSFGFAHVMQLGNAAGPQQCLHALLARVIPMHSRSTCKHSAGASTGIITRVLAVVIVAALEIGTNTSTIHIGLIHISISALG